MPTTRAIGTTEIFLKSKKSKSEEVLIGGRFTNETGLSFFGTDKVNDLIKAGAKVVSVEPEDAVMNKVGESEGEVILVLGGFNIKVVLDVSEIS
jgi:hypothetical protein